MSDPGLALFACRGEVWSDGERKSAGSLRCFSFQEGCSPEPCFTRSKERRVLPGSNKKNPEYVERQARINHLRKDRHQLMSRIPEPFLDLLHSTALVYLATIGLPGEPQVSAV